MYVFGLRVYASTFFLSAFSFFFLFFFSKPQLLTKCFRALFMDSQITLFNNFFFIKNGSHSTIYTFKNYFTTVFSVSAKAQFKWTSYKNLKFENLQKKIVKLHVLNFFFVDNSIYSIFLLKFFNDPPKQNSQSRYCYPPSFVIELIYDFFFLIKTLVLQDLHSLYNLKQKITFFLLSILFFIFN